MIRVGVGYDVHRLVEGRDLILGGILVPSKIGLDGHSDADVLLHAISDALLGAMALGDIGQHFPDTDEKWNGSDSCDLLEHVNELLLESGASINNIDATLALESPKVEPYVDDMRSRIAGVLGLDKSQVSVKATTSEGLGFVGTHLGAAAYAICAVDDGS